MQYENSKRKSLLGLFKIRYQFYCREFAAVKREIASFCHPLQPLTFFNRGRQSTPVADDVHGSD